MNIPPDPDRARRIEIDRVRLAYAHSPVGLFVHYICIGAVVVLLRDDIPLPIMAAWTVMAVAITSARVLLYRSYRKASDPARDVERWRARFILGTVFGGVAFGSAAFLMALLNSLPDQVFLVFIMGGLAGGAVATLSTILLAYRLYSAIAVIPATVVLLLHGGSVRNTMAILLAIYLSFLWRAARNMNESVSRSLSLAFENTALVETLSAANAHAEGMNVDLQEEILYRRRAEEALSNEKERAQVTLESIGDGVISSDLGGMIEYMNPVASGLTGWCPADVHGRHMDEVLTLIDAPSGNPLYNLFDRFLRPEQTAPLPQDILLLHRTSGVAHSVELTASTIRDRAGTAAGVVVVFRDVTALRRMAREMSYQATHDSLTGLVNRHEFERLVEAVLGNTGGDSKHHALMYLDLDQFKVVNDTCGHLAGDELLKQMSIQLQHAIRKNDVLARLGGDEFGILLHGCSLENAQLIADKILHLIRDFRFAWQTRTFDLGVSIGLVPVVSEAQNLVELLSAADAACYVAKDGGRNRVHVYLPDDQVITQRHGEMQWVQRIKQALAENRFRLYYQSVMPLTEGSDHKTYCEVLLRMVDERGELVLPMMFLPAAERYQLMPAVDRWVVQRVLEVMSTDHIILDGFGICAINLSGQSLCDGQFLDFVLMQIADHRVAPERICFEITETAAIANFQQAIVFIAKLRAMGCGFALDDFGSGLSSFSYLKSLPVDFLKIDGSFVRDLVENPIDLAMVESVNHIGHVMGKKTIAEFVENDEILACLRALHVDYAQGFGIQRPLPLDLPAVIPKLA
ncbi:MAG: EAL domain-containing protein [Acidiferrobacterales bacterium]